ncbi:putative beta-lysine N-acetyltransferase [Alkalihalobacillus pseudalcaliphilus]|uniref:putative beta-lysine N-acetyltransferase n=1 Tax=Alkalihalobacillus pseudalcaliphilus TaxID=79884 RepID=UPI00064D9458|nr:putative beta-lysine N-acetyltransferase [Alkalihalobacillus pseudalcaliphilus]KMK76170.1 hypothetical protein AB990_13190 [Alkalihalobacillus pseudalcaliphilus]
MESKGASKAATYEYMELEQVEADLYIDYYNERIRIDHYKGAFKNLLKELEVRREKQPFTKLIVYTKPTQWQQLIADGFQLESIMKGYFNGVDNYVMCRYYSNERKKQGNWVEEDQLIDQVMAKESSAMKRLPDSYEMRKVRESDLYELATFYGTVFSSYPTPIHEVDYLTKSLKGGTLFFIVTFEGEIVAAASAEVQNVFHNAEITDCATNPDHRQFGLIRHIIKELENELYEKRIYCTYSIARANSFGMNRVLKQMGYHYEGRLTNNCFMEGSYENLNVWVKYKK